MKLVWKLSLGLAGLVLVTAAVAGLLVARWTESLALEETREALRREARLAGALVAPRQGAPATRQDLQARIAALGRDIHTRITVIAADGAVLAESDRDPAELDDHANRPEVQEALRQGEGSATRYSRTLETQMMYFALRGERDGKPVLVRLALPLRAVDERLARARSSALLGATLGLLVAILPGYLLARRLTRPIGLLTSAARSVAQGRYDVRLQLEGRDELGELGRAFDVMARELQERLRTIHQERSQLVAILGSMVEGVVAVDERERVVHMNDVAARLLDTDAATSIGLKLSDVTRMQPVCALLAQALGTQAEATHELRLAASPHERALELHATPLRAEGALAGALLVIHDVTALRRLEVARRDVVANVSHELKTPLTAVRAQLETLLDLREDELTLEQRRHFLERALKQVDRLGALVRDLLELSRLESEARPCLEPLDLRGPVSESLRALRPAAEAKGLTLSEVIPAAPAVVAGDAEHLRQVADNLLSNAINYTPSGGNVQVRLLLQPAQAVLEVQDTGIGIEAQDRERIFERFYRVDKARSRSVGGTGLGLAIVKHVVRNHGGEVEVESTPGKGSTFRVRLKRAEPAAPGGGP